MTYLNVPFAFPSVHNIGVGGPLNKKDLLSFSNQNFSLDLKTQEEYVK